MKVTFDSKILQEKIKIATSVTKGPEYVNLKGEKGKPLEILASGNDVNVRITVPDTKVESEGEVTVPTAQVLGLTKGRGKLTLECAKKSSTVNISGSRYKTEFATPPFAPISVESTKNKKVIKFNNALQVLIEDAISKVSLSSVYTEDPIFVFVGSDGKKGGVVACGDQYHFAHYRQSSIDIGSYNFTLPLSTFNVLAILAEKSPYKMSIEGAQVLAFNDKMSVAMPLSQSSEELSLQGFNELIGNFKKSDSWVDIDRSSLIAALDNIDSVYEAGVPLELTVKEKKFNLTFKTGHSSVKEIIKAGKSSWKNKMVVKCDPALLHDLLNSVTSKDIRLQVVAGRTIFIKDENNKIVCHYACCVI